MNKSEFILKYADVEVKFQSYWKYSFTYSAELPDNTVLYAIYGGGHDEIYRHDVNNDQIKISSLYPCAGSVVKDGVLIESFDERY
jgi:hypothetical protein